LSQALVLNMRGHKILRSAQNDICVFVILNPSAVILNEVKSLRVNSVKELF
jgi:hypothetical protein